MRTELASLGLAAIWLFGGLIFWPMARYVDRVPVATYRMLFWLFAGHLAFVIVCGAWLTIRWILGPSDLEGGVILLYVVSAAFSVLSLTTFIAWLLARRSNERVT